MAEQIPLVQVDDEKTNRALQGITERTNRLLGIAFLNGQVVKDQALSGATTFNHKLGRTPQGYIILKQNAAATIFGSNYQDKTMTLTASTAVTVDVWVF